MRDGEKRPAPGVVRCPVCGAYIGHYVERWNGGAERWETWLAVGGAVVRSAHGVCANCGAEWHWSASSRRLERLIGLVRGEVHAADTEQETPQAEVDEGKPAPPLVLVFERRPQPVPMPLVKVMVLSRQDGREQIAGALSLTPLEWRALREALGSCESEVVKLVVR